MKNDFDKFEKRAFGMVFVLWVVGFVLNVLFWGGLIWLAFYLYGRYVG